MKAIKIIVVIITILTVGFFVTGLLVKETTYTTQVKIGKPLEETFTVFTNTSQLKEWIPELISIETIDEKEGKVGSTYKMIVDNNGEELEITEKILAYIPNEKITFYFDAGDMLKTDDYQFISEGNETAIIRSTSSKSNSYIMSCIFPYFKGAFKEIDQNYLNNFKAYAEKQ